MNTNTDAKNLTGQEKSQNDNGGTPPADPGKKADDAKGGDAGKWLEPFLAAAGDNADLKAAFEKFETQDAFKAALEGKTAGDPDNWREAMAGGDSELLKELQRYNSAADAGRALTEAKKKAREKGGVTVPPADAPLEARAAFYNEHFGRPEKVEDIKFEPKLPDGEELAEPEAQIVSGVLQAMWKTGNYGQPHMEAMGQIATDLLIGGRKEMEARKEARQAETRAELKKLWGSDKALEENLRYANGHASYLCASVGVDPAELGNLELSDGTRLGDHPLYAQVMAFGGRDRGEDPGVGEDRGGGGASVQELEAELKKESAKRTGTPRERNEYDTPEAAKRRAELRTKIQRAKGGKSK